MIEPIDLEAFDLGAMARHARTATFAPNWKLVLAADALVGLCLLAAGVAGAFWIHWVGWLLAGVGVIYILMVARRFLQWRWLRRHVGLT